MDPLNLRALRSRSFATENDGLAVLYAQADRSFAQQPGQFVRRETVGIGGLRRLGKRRREAQEFCRAVAPEQVQAAAVRKQGLRDVLIHLSTMGQVMVAAEQNPGARKAYVHALVLSAPGAS
jgi:hypothetical protein